MKKVLADHPTYTTGCALILLVAALGFHFSLVKVSGVVYWWSLLSMAFIVFLSFLLGVLLLWWHSLSRGEQKAAEIGLLDQGEFEISDIFFQEKGILPWLEKNLSRMRDAYSNFERVSQLLGLIDYSAILSRQMKLALNLAHEVFKESQIAIFLIEGGSIKFSAGSRFTPTMPIEDLNEKDVFVRKSWEAIEEDIDLEKIKAFEGKAFSLPVKKPSFRRSLTIMPLIIWNRILGIIVYQIEGCRGLEEEEVVLATLLNRHIAVFVENHYLYQERIRQGRILHEADMARQLQADSLPKGVLHIKGFDIFGLCKACHEISGDYYDLIPLPAWNTMLVAIADVSGKGFPAALFLSKIQTLVRAMADNFTSPSKLLSFLSQQLAKEHLGSLFATMSILVLKREDPAITIASAGHCKPLIVRTKSGFVEEKNFEVGIPLGLFDAGSEEYVDQVIELMPSDGILLYSDGLTDAVNPARTRFGVENLKKSLEKSGDLTSEGIVNFVMDDVEKFRENTPLEDDVTMVYIKFISG